MIGAIAAALGSALAYPLVTDIYNRAVHGTPEDMMKEQLLAQKKAEESVYGGGMQDPYHGLVGGGPSVSDLRAEDEMSEALQRYARSRQRISRARDPMSDELAQLIAGEEARVRSMQMPHRMTPLEAIQLAEGFHG